MSKKKHGTDSHQLRVLFVFLSDAAHLKFMFFVCFKLNLRSASVLAEKKPNYFHFH